ncbi:type I toxin-antitoxin system Ibs family toxin [Escherichia albertii]|uniref:Type I toxin-antitoxin system Ibs family toxin n=2 Tax=Escherichia TaxID=561 RepID=A0A2K3TXZ3_ECOLX|nr:MULTISPECIES: type I toxin-antitoxin system Ibs family toxin [Escherichia]EFX6075565.1 type I toxin-antitoxin system Ibs family toxin [Shigella boydii]EHQ5526692.1 type I toxin-antitoxin system Ibs family toxin [Escherichia coli O2]MBY7618917.1 type I toxin-antitoxin system Ibs family toxin [Escherichia marmotae]AUS68504.1 hypothetical protein CXP54_16260 [Escherichia albertii]EAB1452023.1 type I toxin-antitoxin system Ibs family toxin [Escherichia albertii]
MMKFVIILIVLLLISFHAY